MSAEIYISKIKARRGTNKQRLHTLFDQGELIHTTDTKRLYIGNGVLSGGNHISAKIHPPLTNYYSLSDTIAEVGDLVSLKSVWYQLTASPYTSISNWGNMGTKFSSEFTYDSNSIVTLTLSGLSASKINPESLTNGVKIQDNKIQLNYNTNFFEISSSQLSLKNSGLTNREISSSSFGDGISGGSGNLISLSVNPSSFFFDLSGRLNLDLNSLSSFDGNVSHLPVATFNYLSSLNADIGDIATVNNVFYQLTSLPPVFLENWVNIGPKFTTSFYTTTAYEIDLQPLHFESFTAEEFSRANIDKYGRINYVESSIYDTLTGNSSLNSNSPLSAIFNGTPAHTLSGGIPGITITKFEAMSSNGVTTETITLSSAGFLTFEGGFQTRTGKDVGRFAIPIFAY